MPPQGLLLIAAYLPANWPVRFIDENIRAATNEDFEWAEAVFVSGMHIQRQQMNDICRRAHGFDLPVAIGGPSVSACPNYYPSFDYLHVGELGDATDELIARLAQDPSRPREQVVLKTNDRLADDATFRFRPTSWPKRKNISSAASSFRAAAPTSANSATFPVSTAATRA